MTLAELTDEDIREAIALAERLEANRAIRKPEALRMGVTVQVLCDALLHALEHAVTHSRNLTAAERQRAASLIRRLVEQYQSWSTPHSEQDDGSQEAQV